MDALLHDFCSISFEFFFSFLARFKIGEVFLEPPNVNASRPKVQKRSGPNHLRPLSYDNMVKGSRKQDIMEDNSFSNHVLKLHLGDFVVDHDKNDIITK